MKINSEISPDGRNATVTIEGRVDAMEDLRTPLFDLLENNPQLAQVLMDLTAVDHISSVNRDWLAQFWRVMNQRNPDKRNKNIQVKIREDLLGWLEVAGLVTRFSGLVQFLNVDAESPAQPES